MPAAPPTALLQHRGAPEAGGGAGPGVMGSRGSTEEQPGTVACACNPSSGEAEAGGSLSPGVLGCRRLCRAGVRAKAGTDMVAPGEPGVTRSPKEG